MLIKDLSVELDAKAMAVVAGGTKNDFLQSANTSNLLAELHKQIQSAVLNGATINNTGGNFADIFLVPAQRRGRGPDGPVLEGRFAVVAALADLKTAAAAGAVRPGSSLVGVVSIQEVDVTVGPSPSVMAVGELAGASSGGAFGD